MGGQDKLLFGEVDLDLGEGHPPDSHTRPTPPEMTRFVPGAGRAATDQDDAADSTRVGKVDDSILSQMRERRPADPTSVVNPASAPPPSSGQPALSDPRIDAMRELYASGDADGALFIASAVQAHVRETNPPPPSDDSIDVDMDDDRDERTAISGSGVQVTNAMRGCPRMLMSLSEVAALPLDPRAGFLMMHFDGMSTIEDIVDACAMPKADTLTILRQLLALKVIALDA